MERIRTIRTIKYMRHDPCDYWLFKLDRTINRIVNKYFIYPPEINKDDPLSRRSLYFNSSDSGILESRCFISGTYNVYSIRKVKLIKPKKNYNLKV